MEGNCDSIIYKVADFLSDVWDSNAMEEFKRIEAFEERAVQAFMRHDYKEGDDTNEFSVEQKVGACIYRATPNQRYICRVIASSFRRTYP